MAFGTRVREWLRPLAYLGQNALTLAGAALTTSAALTMIVFWVAEVLRERPSHPYEGIFLFLILAVVATLTAVNLFLLTTASYKGVEYMESNQFCGLTCLPQPAHPRLRAAPARGGRRHRRRADPRPASLREEEGGGSAARRVPGS